MEGYQLLSIVLGVVVLIIAFEMYERWKWQKIAREGILCEFTTDTRRAIKKIGKLGNPLPNGTPVIIKDRKGLISFSGGQKKEDETVYIVTKDSTYDVEMPDNALLGVLVKVTVPKVYYKMGNPIPQMFESSRGIATGRILADMFNEKATQIAMSESVKNAERDEQLKQKLNPMYIYAGLIAMCLLGLVSVYFAYKASSNVSDVKDSIDVIRKGMGIGG
jgi:hypothetical protein